MKPTTFALATGAFVGATGLLGFFSGARKETFERREEMKLTGGYGKIAGAIPTNTLFNWVRVGIGVAGIAASFDEESAKVYNRTLAVSYAGMAVMGLIPKADTLFGTMPIFGGNVLLHAGTAAAEILTEDELIESAKDLVAGSPETKANGRSKSGGHARA